MRYRVEVVDNGKSMMRLLKCGLYKIRHRRVQLVETANMPQQRHSRTTLVTVPSIQTGDSVFRLGVLGRGGNTSEIVAGRTEIG